MPVQYKHFVPLLVAIAFATTVNFPLYSATYYVDASRPNDTGDGLSVANAKKSIKAAVKTATAFPGDHLIYIAPGIYTGQSNRQITLSGANLKLRGTGDAAQTIIDLERQGNFLTYRDPEAACQSELLNLTIRNGAGVNGGAIHAENGKLLITNCIFQDNYGKQQGGALSLSDGIYHLNHCTFLANGIPDPVGSDMALSGGALYITDATVDISHSTYELNRGGDGGAISLAGRTTLNVANSIFKNNNALNIKEESYTRSLRRLRVRLLSTPA